MLLEAISTCPDLVFAGRCVKVNLNRVGLARIGQQPLITNQIEPTMLPDDCYKIDLNVAQQ